MSRPRPVPGTSVRIDPHPHDSPFVNEDPQPEGTPHDLRDAGSIGRGRYATGSPMVYKRVQCSSCGRTGWFYGREEHAPGRDHLCDRCTPAYIEEEDDQ